MALGQSGMGVLVHWHCHQPHVTTEPWDRGEPGPDWAGSVEHRTQSISLIMLTWATGQNDDNVCPVGVKLTPPTFLYVLMWLLEMVPLPLQVGLCFCGTSILQTPPAWALIGGRSSNVAQSHCACGHGELASACWLTQHLSEGGLSWDVL